MRPLNKPADSGFEAAAAWCAGCAVAYLMLSNGLGVAGSLLLQHWLGGPGAGAASARYELLLWGGNLLAAAVGLLVPVWLACRVGGLAVRRMRLNRPAPGRTVPALVLYLGCAQLAGLAAGLVGRAAGGGQTHTLPESAAARLVAFGALCVVPALLEELLFRGAMQGLLRPYGTWVAVWAQAVPFALLHKGAGAAVFALAAGLFFGWLAERCGSILPGMLLHFVNNSLAFLQLLLTESGALGLAKLLRYASLAVWPPAAVAALVLLGRRGLWRLRLNRHGRPLRLVRCLPWMGVQVFLLLYSLLGL